MWKTLASGGTVAHAAVGTWSLAHVAGQMEPAGWVLAGMYALGPAVLGLVLTVLVTMATTPPVVFTVEQDA
jgi:hypothetical protein